MSQGIDRPDRQMGRRTRGYGLHLDQDAEKPRKSSDFPTAARQGLQKEANAKRRQREQLLSKADPEDV